ncbi:hypothetical protein CTAYLR_004099 [Chrysophaeum taylorii]|uniref:THH1/TOM1/TOM3 domain-containing protein n=1 Tax=Chrysophaeum taylorii TaxID=2483200 RepID=A0AAD7XNT2_9STRA|nr:hypothetical protein CTAYLR_004099 [Chrysophaeum taylorii]
MRGGKNAKVLRRSPFLEAVMFQDSSNTMKLLSLLYFCMTLHAFSQLRRNWGALDTKSLFLLSMSTACALRLMCFVGFCLLDETRQHVSPTSYVTPELDMYARAVVLLFDIPDFVLVSTYVLLLVVWAECFVGSRRHWLSARNYKETWHRCYLGLNVVLYGTQLSLYCALVSSDRTITLLYLVPAIATFAVPVVHFVFYVFLALRFAGFPMVSNAKKDRLERLTRVTAAWTVGRVFWATAVLTSVFKKTVPGATVGGVAIVALFLLTEICPFILTLDSGLLNSLLGD